MNLLRDIRYGWRMMMSQRTFSAVVALTVALAIGANTVIFSFVDILVLRPLPVRDEATLGWVYNVAAEHGDRAQSSMADLIDMRGATRSFSALAGLRSSTFTLSSQGIPERVSAREVTANLFDVWGLRPALGHLFNPGDDAPGAAPVVVISHQYWQRHFGSDSGIVGKALTLDGVPHTVTGVLSPAIEIGNLSRIDVWAPLIVDGTRAPRDDRRVQIIGRLASGVTHDQATSEMHTIAQRLQRDFPTTNTGWDARVATTHEAMTGKNTWLVLTLLVIVVAFVLLIACANLANLMLARATERRREIVVRVALGASRGGIIRQLVTESILLGIAGGALGLLLGYGGLRLIQAFAYEEIFAMLSISRNVLLFAASASLLTPILFSVLPAIHASRADLSTTLRQGSGRSIGGARRARSALVVSQVSLALSLVAVAVLVVRSMIATRRVDLGFEPKDVLTFRVDAPAWRYADSTRLSQLHESILREIRGLSGVRNVALVSSLPVLGGQASGRVRIEGRDSRGKTDQPWAARAVASENYFETAGIPVIAGRSFTSSDNSGAAPVAIVSREMARRYWGSIDAALGKRVAMGNESEAQAWRVIIGVSDDVRPIVVTMPPDPQVYLPLAQTPVRGVSVMIRSKAAGTLAGDVRAAMRRVDGELAIYDLQTMTEAFQRELSSDVVLTGMFSAFAAIALLLAGAGLYGVISYSLSQRTQEIGIRLALGASPGTVRSMVAREAGRLIGLGVAGGLLGGLLLAQAMRSVLYGVTPFDPMTYVMVVTILGVVVAVALYVPTRRVTRIDPVRALRGD